MDKLGEVHVNKNSIHLTSSSHRIQRLPRSAACRPAPLSLSSFSLSLTDTPDHSSYKSVTGKSPNLSI